MQEEQKEDTNTDPKLKLLERIAKPSLRPKQKKELLGSGMSIIQETDITENIKLALAILSAERKEMVDTNVPILLRNLIETFAGIRGTRIYNAFHDGTASYICATLKNTA